MSTDTDTTPATAEVAPTAEPPTLLEQLGQAAIVKVVVDAAKADQAAIDALIRERMIAERGRTAAKSFEVIVPGVDGAVATIGLKDTDASAYVADPKVFAEYVEKFAPTEVELVPQVRPSFTTAFLKGVELVEVDGELVAFSPKTGEPVPGIRVKPAAKNTGVTGLVWKKGKRDLVEQHLREQRAAEQAAVTDGSVVTGEVVTDDTKAVDQ